MNPVEGVHYIFDRYAFLNSILKERYAKKFSLSKEAKKAFYETKFEDAQSITSFQNEAADQKNRKDKCVPIIPPRPMSVSFSAVKIQRISTLLSFDFLILRLGLNSQPKWGSP